MRLISPILLLAVVAFLALFGTWIYRGEKQRRQNVALEDDQIVLRFKGTVTRLAVKDIARVRYSWVASFTFWACWEIESFSGQTIPLGWEAVGLDTVLSGLETFLPGFSSAEAKRIASEGDVHGETICAWQAAA